MKLAINNIISDDLTTPLNTPFHSPGINSPRYRGHRTLRLNNLTPLTRLPTLIHHHTKIKALRLKITDLAQREQKYRVSWAPDQETNLDLGVKAAKAAGLEEVVDGLVGVGVLGPSGQTGGGASHPAAADGLLPPVDVPGAAISHPKKSIRRNRSKRRSEEGGVQGLTTTAAAAEESRPPRE